MPEKPNVFQRFWKELKKRNVHRVLAIYAGTAFVILEAADIIFPRWGLPDWTIDLVLYLLILGAIIAVIISWIYDITPKGIIKTDDIESLESGTILIETPKKRKNASNIIIAILIIVVGILIYPKIFKRSTSLFNETQRNSIAVLPLRVIGDEQDLKFLSSGLVESMTHMLAKIGNTQRMFTVIPASEVVETTTAIEAKQKFGATMVITGSIQLEENAGRIILNLINTKKQQLIKSQKLEYKKQNNFVLQDEAIKVIVDMLGLDISSFIENQLVGRGSDTFEANELYLIGKGIIRDGIETVQDIETAINLFQLAIKKDSTFALAYNGISRANIIKYQLLHIPDYIIEAVKYSEIALSMDASNAEILLTYASALTDIGKYNEADSIFQISLHIDSLNPRLFSDYGYLYDVQNKPEIAEKYHKKAIELDPNNWVSIFDFAMFYAFNNRFQEALIQIRKALELAPGHLTLQHGLGNILLSLNDLDGALHVYENIYKNDSTQAHVVQNLGVCYFFKEDYNNAIKYFQKSIKYNPEYYKYYESVGWSYYALHQQEKANTYFRQALSLALKGEYLSSAALHYSLLGMKDSANYYIDKCNISNNPLEHSSNASLGYSYIFLVNGDKEKALKFLESALERGTGWMDVKYHHIFKDLKSDPEFKAMLARVDTLR